MTPGVKALCLALVVLQLVQPVSAMWYQHDAEKAQGEAACRKAKHDFDEWARDKERFNNGNPAYPHPLPVWKTSETRGTLSQRYVWFASSDTSIWFSHVPNLRLKTHGYPWCNCDGEWKKAADKMDLSKVEKVTTMPAPTTDEPGRYAVVLHFPRSKGLFSGLRDRVKGFVKAKDRKLVFSEKDVRDLFLQKIQLLGMNGNIVYVVPDADVVRRPPVPKSKKGAAKSQETGGNLNIWNEAEGL